MSDVAALLDLAQRITQRVCDEVSNAQLVWAHFEATNGASDDDRAQLRAGVSRLGLGNVMKALRLAVARDTLMALFRVTDNPGKDKDCLTLCHLSLLLGDERLHKDRLIAAAGWSRSTYPELREKNAATCANAMRAFKDAVPHLIGKTIAPARSKII